MNFDNITIPTYVINLEERSDRRMHTIKQFEGKAEFELQIVDACKDKTGAVGLWNSIVKIINIVKDSDDDLIIICEDDHVFTEFYNRDKFIQNIIEAANNGVELLSGGIGGFQNAIPITDNLFWIDTFWSTQFIVLYRPIFQKILNKIFQKTDTADGVFSELTSHKMVIYPFISIQADFGYSDVTCSNNEINGLVTNLFKESERKMKLYKDTYLKYLAIK